MININEYLLSKKKNKSKEKPKFGCSVDELKEWLISVGAEEKDFINFDGTLNEPEQGNLYLEIGPCEDASNQHWITVINKLKYNLSQRVCIRTKIESFFKQTNSECKPIDFDTALRIAEYMIANKDTEVNLSDFKND